MFTGYKIESYASGLLLIICNEVAIRTIGNIYFEPFENIPMLHFL